LARKKPNEQRALRAEIGRGRYLAALEWCAEFLPMPTNPPLTASGSRELKHPRPIPAAVRRACLLMIYGDDDGRPLDFVEAARRSGVRPNIMRKWLHRVEVQILLRAERKAFRSAINCANEAVLADIRQNALNSMARVAAVRALQELDAEDHPIHRRGEAISPHVTIVIRTDPAPIPKVIEHVPAELEPLELEPVERRGVDGYRCDENGQRVFDPDRPRY
jgi:hypothetical protein